MFCFWYLNDLSQVTAKTLAQHDELMKKTETMNILMDTNKMLREEKEKMTQELQELQAKVSTSFYCKKLVGCLKLFVRQR